MAALAPTAIWSCRVVEASRAELERVDFAPFLANADLPIAMTAHVVYDGARSRHARHFVENGDSTRRFAARSASTAC